MDVEFGHTLDDIERDGFLASDEVAVTYSRTEGIGIDIIQPEDIVYAMSGIMMDLADIFCSKKPDVLLVYGDRYEALAAVIAGFQMGVPVAHIEGGDITQGGVLDDSVRHAMTKLSHLHFTTNEEATQRILSMGEESWRVHTIGLPTIDSIKQGHFATSSELFRKYHIRQNRPIVLFCQHSITTEWRRAGERVKPSLGALRVLAREGVQVIILYPCNDAGGKLIIQELEKLRNVENIQIHKSLSWYDYHGILNLCGREGKGVVAGNSSAGIKETPIFNCPAVNIGGRQEGRLRSDNIIDVDYRTDQILCAIRLALNPPDWLDKRWKNCYNPYGDGTASAKIVDILTTVKLGKRLIRKKTTC